MATFHPSPSKPKLELPRGACDTWSDAIPFARKLVSEFGERTLWGTDWPHPNLKEVPDDGLMVDLIGEIAPTEAQRDALLVDNPQRFYGFE
jgi:2-pyrone-4,6-dicarboxylate lactonase